MLVARARQTPQGRHPAGRAARPSPFFDTISWPPPAVGFGQGDSSPWRKSPLHSSGDASRLTALLLGQICPIFSLVPPCQAGASPLSVQRGVSPRAARATMLATCRVERPEGQHTADAPSTPCPAQQHRRGSRRSGRRPTPGVVLELDRFDYLLGAGNCG